MRGRIRSAALVVAMLLTGCGAASHDNPAFTGAPSAATAPSTAPSAGSAGPAITQVEVGSVQVPRLVGGSGAPAIDAALTTLGRHLGTGGIACSVTTTRADVSLASFRWRCSDHSVATATYSIPTGAELALGGILTGGYLQYLSSTASAQLTAGGTAPATVATVAAPTAAALSRWDLTPDSLEITFPLPSGAAMISFPLTSLQPYLAPGGPLH